ncbi:MAG: Cys-tRNA(Pro) deacylase [Chloroflexi bacterium]|nr:Cys-tRNA(Pro) deacylase [Chloroflexota bacterium]
MQFLQKATKALISNNVTRFLDSKKIKYTAFELPAEKLGAEETARFLSIPLEKVFKTIVVLRQRGKPLLCVVSGEKEVDLKAVAIILGEKKVNLPTQNEAEKITGLMSGGISPLALLNKGFSTFVDVSVNQHEEIYISGGQRGLSIRLQPSDLQSITNAKIAPIAKD